MKVLNVIMLLILTICFSCSKSKVEVVADKLRFELQADQKSNSETSDKITLENIVAEMHVKSYDARTGEIVLNHSHLDQIGEWKDNGYKVMVYNAEEYLFTLTFATSIYSFLYNEPVLYYSLRDNNEGTSIATQKNKWYILSGYPYGELLDNTKITDPEQLKSFESIHANWNVFVESLKKAGKYKN